MKWYYIECGQKVGPVSDIQLDERVRAGQLTADALVWREGMADWQPYGRVRSVNSASAPQPATGRLSCALCAKSFPPDEVIAFEGACVCAACKPLLVQRVREGLTVGHGSVNAWRDGDLVVTFPRSTLAGRCVKCNGVESLSHTSSELHWHPLWVYAMLLLTPLAYWLGLLLTEKSSWVTISVCKHHRNQRSSMSTASWLYLLAALCLGVAAVAYSNSLLVILAGTVLATGAFVFRRQWNPLSAAKVEGNYVWLRGCGRAFVDALPEFNQREHS